MIRSALAAALASSLASTAAVAQEGPPYDADAVVVIVMKANPDFRGFCMSGPGNIRKVVTETVIDLAQKGQIKGEPRSVGEEAGGKITQQCRGG